MKISNETRIGIVLIIAVVILFTGLNFLKGRSLFKKDTVYYSYYERVDGLKVSSSVEYRGYQVGQVSDIRFSGIRSEKVLVEFTVNEKIKLPKDSRARIFSQDLMSTKAINLESGISEMTLKEGDTLIGDIEKDLKDQVSMQILPLKTKAERMLASLDSVLVVIQYIFTEETKSNIKNSLSSIRRTLRNIESTSGSLDSIVKSEGSRLGNIFQNIESVSGNLRDNNDNIANILENISALSDSVVDANIGNSLREINKAVSTINVITQKVSQDEGSLGALLNNRDLYNNLNETSQNLNKLMIEIRKNPKRFVRFSLVDFSNGEARSRYIYAVVVKSSNIKLDVSDKLFKSKYLFEEYYHNGIYLYIYNRYKKLKVAEKILKSLKSEYPQVYIEKISVL